MCWEPSRAFLTHGTTPAGPTDGDPPSCRRQPHLLARLRLRGFQLRGGPGQCKAIWLPTGLRPSQQLSQMGQGGGEEPLGPGPRRRGGERGCGACFSHIGTAHDCSERRDTSKNVLVPKSAKQMVVVRPGGAALEGLLASLHPWKQPVPDVQAHYGASGGKVLLRHSRICLCSVYGPSVIH